MDILSLINITTSILLIVFSFYFIMIYRYLPLIRKAVLYLAILTFIVSIRSFLRIPIFFEKYWIHPLLLRIDYLTYFAGLPVYISFIGEFFKSKFHPIVKRICIYVSIPFILLLGIPNQWFIQFRWMYHIISIVFSIYTIYIASLYFYSNEKYAKVRFFAIIFLFMGFILDIVLVEVYNKIPFVFPIIMIVFCFTLILMVNVYLSQQRDKLAELQEEIVQAKEEVEQQYEFTKEQEAKLQILNSLYESLLELSKKIASSSDFNSILDEIVFHLEKNFGIKFFVIMTINSEKQEASFFSSNLDKKLTPEQFDFMTKGLYSFDLTQKGIHYGVYVHKKPIYLKHFKKSNYEFENQLVEKLNLKSLIVFPLIYNNEVFGFFDITHANEPLHLSNEKYLNLYIFVQYFAQLFKNYLFVQEIQKQKKQLEIKNKQIQNRNEIIQSMNETISLMNTTYDIEKILDYMIDFLNKKFSLNYFLYYKYDRQKNQLIYAYSNFEHLYDKSIIDKIKNNTISLEDKESIHVACCLKKRYVFLSTIKHNRSIVEEENKKLLNMSSLLIFPLYAGEELLGTLDFSHFGERIQLDKIQLTLIKIFIDQFASILKNKILIEDLEHKQLELEKSLFLLDVKSKELEKINEFTKKINSTTDFNLIIQDIFQYFNETYHLEFSWLILVDEKEKVFKSSAFSEIFYSFSPFVIDFLKNFSAPLNENTGTLYRTYKKKKYFYIPRILENFQGSFWDNKVIEVLKLKWLLQVPLVVQNNTIGIISFTNYTKTIKLKIEDLQALQHFCDQIAGALYTSYLFEQVKLEKRKVEEAQKEISQLNEFTKQIMEEEDFDKLIQNIFEYLRNKYELQFGWLLLIDKEKNIIKTSSFSKNIIEIPEDMYSYLKNFSFPYNEELGTIYRTIQRKKHLYLKRISNNFKGTKIDKELVSITKLKWVLYVPLILKGEAIGLLAFTNYEKNVYLDLQQIHSIEVFCTQIVGAIYNSYLRENIEKEKEKADRLLFNILPRKVAEELKEYGYVKPRLYKNATILFTDFVGFTKVASEMSPDDLIQELDRYFHQFDEIITRNNLTKLKTIGDSYMCVGGIPEDNKTHTVDACLAALEIKNLIKKTNEIRQQLNMPFWNLRIGINTGEVIAGIIGKERFAYDVWGDAVNIAQRLESTSLPYEINISRTTYEKIKYFYKCEYRGKHVIKNRGYIDMFFIKRIHPRLCNDEEGYIPNEKFFELYNKLKNGATFVFKHELQKKYY